MVSSFYGGREPPNGSIRESFAALNTIFMPSIDRAGLGRSSFGFCKRISITSNFLTGFISH
jgi:hypothetical protein